MNKLIELLKSKGLYSDSLNVNCHMGLRYAGQKDSIYSGKADEYKPFPFKITVTDDKNEILSITEADLPYGDIDGAEFEAVAEWLRDVGYHRTGRHRIWDTLVETGSEAPDDIVIETCNIAVAVEIAELKNRIDDLLFDLDDDAPAEEEDRVLSEIDEIHWRLFQLTDVFAKFPCDRDRYDIVAASHREYSAKSPGLSFKEYYRYFLKSEELLDSDGNLTDRKSVV